MRVMKGNISKKVMIAILSASMTMTPAVGAMMVPITVCAVTIDDNPLGQTIDVVNSGQEMDINYGTVGDNYGEVNNNNGTVTNNYGEVNNNNGTVTNNYGTVTNSDSRFVVNNYGGTVTGEVQNQFYLVNFVAPENGTVNYEDDFTQSNTNYYIQTTGKTIDNEDPTETGTITVTPSTNYKITGDEVQNQNGQDSGSSSTFTYSVARSGTAYVITIASPTGNISSIGMDTFNLLIRAIVTDDPDDDNGSENTNTPTVILNDDGTATVVVEDSNRNSSEQAIAPASTAKQITEMSVKIIQDKLLEYNSGHSASTVFEIDLGNDPSLNGDMVKALSFGGRHIKCDFTHDGKSYTLVVPPFDSNSTEFKACLDVLSKEQNGFAGPMKLAQLFATCGFTLISLSDNTGSNINSLTPQTSAVSQNSNGTHSDTLSAASGVAENISAQNAVNKASEAVDQAVDQSDSSSGFTPFAAFSESAFRSQSG